MSRALSTTLFAIGLVAAPARSRLVAPCPTSTYEVRASPLLAMIEERGDRLVLRGDTVALGGCGSTAVEWALRDLDAEATRVAALRDRFEAGLPADAVVFGRTGRLEAGGTVRRLPNTSNFALPGLNAETAVIAIDLEGVAVSSGAACSSGKVRSSRVLAAMGVAPELAKGALRVSFGHESKESDVDEALHALARIAARRAVREAVA